MNVYVFSSKKPVLGGAAVLPLAALDKHSPGRGDLSYLDISGLSGPALKKTLGLLKRKSLNAAYGILDPKGESPDPAAFFFDGAADYIGPKALKAGIEKKRFKAALAWRGAEGEVKKDTAEAPGKTEKRSKFPAGKFPPWTSIRSGTAIPALFLFVSLSGPGKTNLRSRLGEAGYKLLQTRLRMLLQQRFQEANALLWMETESNCLLLIPPKAESAKAAAVASLKLVLAAPLIAAETFGIFIPLSFTIAMHYGKTPYHAPGKTGTLVSDAVNFIFHLGTKCAEPGRLTLSGEVPPEGIAPLADLFVPAAEFEGRSLLHSRLFAYSAQP
jgi:hypothetical protein